MVPSKWAGAIPGSEVDASEKVSSQIKTKDEDSDEPPKHRKKVKKEKVVRKRVTQSDSESSDSEYSNKMVNQQLSGGLSSVTCDKSEKSNKRLRKAARKSGLNSSQMKS